MRICPARVEDLDAITDLLRSCALPTEGVAHWLESFRVVRRDGRPIAVAGVERYGRSGLLRSVAVKPEHRGDGLASRLCAELEQRSAREGIDRLFLLTETAEAYFAARGYRTVPRSYAPADVAASPEMAALCPQSAPLMVKVLGPILHTERLLLRPWRAADTAPFAALCADPKVMRHFPSTLTGEQARRGIERCRDHFARYGFGLWVVEAPGVCEHAGFVGLNTVTFSAPFTPAVEVGWRLAAGRWGRGWATEAARAAVQFGFEQIGLDEIVSFTVPRNRASVRVMEKLGMHRDQADDFDHPALPEGHPLRRHVLYRLAAQRAVRIP